ncbi:CD48 antigen-like isoform X2 [Equus przewalskii]|uniref:CD48 antigen-like isoform X2 n=1 Tax=Equus przewalskii TaxID=9798 RepID=A0ABM4NI84_EQUPR
MSSQAVKDPSSSCTLQRTVAGGGGGSVQLQLTFSPSTDIREIEWLRDSGDERDLFLVSWKPNTYAPEWYGLEEKYKHRFSLTELEFLIIRNLSMEMSGVYTTKIKFQSGKSQEEAFKLCLYEPIPQPQIQIHPSSRTSGWCNISLECGTPGATENLAVTWLSKGLPRELQPRETLGPAPNSRNLSLSLALGQLNGHLTCVVSNPVDEKNATLHLENICPSTGSLQSKRLWRGIRPTVLMVGLGAGVWIWMRKKTETGRGGSALLPEGPSSAAAPQALPTEESADLQPGGADSHDSPYMKISLLGHPEKDMEKGSCHSYSPDVLQ